MSTQNRKKTEYGIALLWVRGGPALSRKLVRFRGCTDTATHPAA